MHARWTTASPAFAQTALWLLPYRMSRRGFERGFDREKIVKDARTVASRSLDDNDAFTTVLKTRLGRGLDFHAAEDSLYWCTTGLVVNSTPQAALFFVFYIQARTDDTIRAYAEKLGCLGSAAEVTTLQQAQPHSISEAPGGNN